MKTLKPLLTLAGLAIGFAAEAAPIIISPTPSAVRVRSTSAAGSGCAANTLAVKLTNKRIVEVNYQDMVAHAGPGVPFGERRKNCNIFLDLAYPAGWTYAVLAVETKGFVAVDRDASALVQTSAYFQGSSTTVRTGSTITGPIERNLLLSDTFAASALNWAPCNAARALVLNTEVRATASGSDSAFIALTDSNRVKTKYTLVWKRCR